MTSSELVPRHVGEAAAILREANRGPFAFRGGGTKDDWWLAPPSLVISTKGLSGIVRHDPAEGVVVVDAGTTLREVQQALSDHEQWVALDPPLADQGATIGGIFSVNDAGPRRLGFGTLRDSVIGATLITGDGRVVRSGGRVIKNVAGFDLARLYCGAIGSLGMVAQLALRVQPIRAHSYTVTTAATPAETMTFSGLLREAGVEATALDWTGPVDPTLAIRVEQRTRIAAMSQARAAAKVVSADGRSVEVLDQADEEQVWRQVSRVMEGDPGDTVIRIGTRPTRMLELVEVTVKACNEAQTTLAWDSHAVLGLHTLRLQGGRPAQAIAHIRQNVDGWGGYVVTRRRGSALDLGCDRWGVTPSSMTTMRRLKHEFDPYRQCAPGTFVGGI
jgi:glycolate oxidase FAD binding subunit